MSEFTKGPWSTVDGSESGHCCFEKTILDANGENVCELWSDHASLIEAVPDMYEALSETLSMIERQPDFNDDGDGMLISRCKRALEKARGDL